MSCHEIEEVKKASLEIAEKKGEFECIFYM
jgi:hypothetical protein